MTATKHTIEIDAQAAFRKLGVDLRISPIADQCVKALQKRLTGCITTELVIAALTDAGRASKPRRGVKKSADAGANANLEGKAP